MPKIFIFYIQEKSKSFNTIGKAGVTTNLRKRWHLHSMIFRHFDPRVDRIQWNFEINTEDVQFNFGIQTLNHGTTLKKLAPHENEI